MAILQQSRVGIGSFLEELDKTIGDNTQEPKESVLEKILEPKYEIPGLSAYSRVIGKLSDILDAPVEKERKEFAEIAGIDVKDVHSAVGGTSLGLLLGQPGLLNTYITPGDIPPLLAPASGDPETGEYSPLDVGFAVADVATLGASKAVRGIGRKVLDDLSDAAKSFREKRQIKRMERDISRIGAESPEALSEGATRGFGGTTLSPEAERAFARASEFRAAREELTEELASARHELVRDLSDVRPAVALDREEALRRGLPVDVETGALPEGWTPTAQQAAGEKEALTKAGIFKSTGIEELAHIEEIALEKGAVHGVKLLPPEGKFKNLDVLKIDDESGVIARRKKSVTEKGFDINRDVLIGRKRRGKDIDGEYTDEIEMISFNPETGDAMATFGFRIRNVGGQKLVEGTSFFEEGSSAISKMHSGMLMNDFIANVLRNDWIISPNNSYTFDSFLPLIQRAVANKMQIIFDSASDILPHGELYSRMSTSGGGRSKWGKLSFTAMVNKRGEFTGEGLSKIMKEIEDQLRVAEEYGGLVGKPDFQTPSKGTLTRLQLSQVDKEKIIKEHGIRRGREIIQDMIDEYKDVGRMTTRSTKSSDIGWEKKFKGHTEITYNSITIKKLKGIVAGALGMNSAEEFDEFLNYNPESMEAQVFDNEQLF